LNNSFLKAELGLFRAAPGFNDKFIKISFFFRKSKGIVDFLNSKKPKQLRNVVREVYPLRVRSLYFAGFQIGFRG